MAIELRALNTLDAAQVQQALAETVQRVREDNPSLDVSRGVFAELLAYYHAVLDTQRRQNINDYLNARSLIAIEADPTLADPDLVDDVLSNFGLTRQAGRSAQGEVTIVVSDDTTVTIGEGTVWEAQGLTYLTTQVFTAKAEEAQIVSDADRLLTQTADGNYAFTITLVAAAPGSEYNLKKDTLIVPVILPPNYVTSFATSDFVEGLADETNEELLVRLQEGIAAKALSNRVNMAAMLRQIDAFSRIVAMSIVGYGDGELVRAYHSILPIALSGRCDWYIRTQETLQRSAVTVTATLLSIATDLTGTWQFAVTRDLVPGFYEITDIRPLDSDPSQGGFTITLDTRGIDMTGSGFRPDVITATEGAYSAFSTSVVRFNDTRAHTDVSVGDTREYQATITGVPLIGDIQTHVSGRDVRPYGGDCLVKAPVPCFVTLHFTIYKKTGQADPDTVAIQTALAKLINTLGFTGVLFASQIQDVIHRSLSNGQVVGAIDIHGRIRYPDGSITYVRDSEKLQVPSDPAAMVTANTVQFFADTADVNIAVSTLLPSAI